MAGPKVVWGNHGVLPNDFSAIGQRGRMMVYRSLSHQIFLTDEEFRVLAGVDLLLAVEMLASHEASHGICASCGGRCCLDIGCGFFSPMFDYCPIYEYRPAKCRAFFCEKVAGDNALDPAIRQLLDREITNLANVADPRLVGAIFADPGPTPEGGVTSLTGLDTERRARSIVQDMVGGHLHPSAAAEQLTVLVLEHRRANLLTVAEQL